jgi:protein required for attachment to host cells
MKHLARNARVLVVDGAHAKVLRNDAIPPAIDLKPMREAVEPAPASHELGRAPPPRTNDSMGRRSAMEAPDYHQRAEDAFVAKVVSAMTEDLERGDFSQIVVAAPPSALAVLRKAWTPKLSKATVLELDKDLTHHTPRQIGDIIGKALEAAGG